MQENTGNVYSSPRNGSERFAVLHSTCLRDRDIQKLISLYAADAVLLLPHSPGVKGVPAIRKSYQSMLTTGAPQISVECTDFLHLQGLSVESGRYALRKPNGGGFEISDQGKYIETWRLQADGEFRITASIWTSDSRRRWL